jgi:hypothetical protein
MGPPGYDWPRPRFEPDSVLQDVALHDFDIDEPRLREVLLKIAKAKYPHLEHRISAPVKT